jgi:hypothetical protein
MKIKIAILMFGCISAMAQSDGNFLGTSPAAFGYTSPEQIKSREERRANAEYNFIPKDPWREIDGQTNLAKSEGWVNFSGKVLEVQPTGIRVDGDYGIPPNRFPEENRGTGIFFVSGFPYQLAENEIIDGRDRYTAKENGVYTYPTAIGGTSTIRKLDYGVRPIVRFEKPTMSMNPTKPSISLFPNASTNGRPLTFNSNALTRHGFGKKSSFLIPALCLSQAIVLESAIIAQKISESPSPLL